MKNLKKLFVILFLLQTWDVFGFQAKYDPNVTSPDYYSKPAPHFIYPMNSYETSPESLHEFDANGQLIPVPELKSYTDEDTTSSNYRMIKRIKRLPGGRQEYRIRNMQNDYRNPANRTLPQNKH